MNEESPAPETRYLKNVININLSIVNQLDS